VATNPDSKTEASLWQKVKRWGVVDTYLGFTRTTRIIFAVMFAVGVVLCVSLWLTDLGIGFTRPSWVTRYGAEWLHSHAYIPNILAGLTGFLVGVPVAAVILATFTIQREEIAAIDRVNRLSKSAWYTFRDAVYEFCSEARITALENDAPLIDGSHDDAFRALQEYIELWRSLPFNISNADEVLAEKANAIRNHVFDTPQELANRMRADPESVSMAWAGVVGAWNILDQYVRLQRLELNLDWFQNRLDTMIRKWMSLPENPFLAFVDVHGFILVVLGQTSVPKQCMMPRTRSRRTAA
jgi:hypothetical protein